MASPKSGKYGDIRLSTGTQLAEATNWKASIKSNNPAFATNVTPGWKKRVGGVKDGELSFDLLDNANAYFDVGDAISIALYTSTSVLWTTMPVLVDDYGLEVDIDNGAPLKWATKASSNGVPTPWPPNANK